MPDVHALIAAEHELDEPEPVKADCLFRRRKVLHFQAPLLLLQIGKHGINGRHQWIERIIRASHRLEEYLARCSLHIIADLAATLDKKAVAAQSNANRQLVAVNGDLHRALGGLGHLRRYGHCLAPLFH
jgi:hypothetical protein